MITRHIPELNLSRLSKRTLVIMLASISLITINPRINGWNEASRMALTQSLVEHHTLQIDASVFVRTGDKVFVKGHFYSDKPSLPSLLAALVYAPLFALGLQLDYGWNLSYYLIVLLTIKLFWFGNVLAFRKALTFTSVMQDKYNILTLIYALASLSFSWSATFNNHSLAASSLMIALMFYLKTRQGTGGFAPAATGLFGGIAAAADMPTGIFLAGLGVLIMIHRRSWLDFWQFLVAALLPLSIHALVNYTISGSLVPLQIVPEFLDYPGSVWAHSPEVTGVRFNAPLAALRYALLSLLGPRGFLWYNPLLFLLLPILWHHLQQGSSFRAESWMILTASTILSLYYFLMSSNFSGWSYSIRWLVPLLPGFFFYLFDLEYLLTSPWKISLFRGLVAVSVLIAVVGLINPWSNLELYPVAVIANLKQLFHLMGH